MTKYYLTAGRLINDVAVDVGSESAADPVASADKQFVQLTRQLNIAIEEMAEVNDWAEFKRTHTFVTITATYPDGEYPLPTDFHYMVDQTHWDRTNNAPLIGPLSSQQWHLLLGADTTSVIDVTFRQVEGIMALYPTVPDDGLTIAYEYASTNWIRNAADNAYLKAVVSTGDTVLLPPSLIRAYLKMKYNGSKGFQTIDANQAVSMFLDSSGGKDVGAPKLSLTGRGSRYRMMGYRNIPETGFGA